MPLTLAEYRSHVQHALGGGVVASQLNQDQIINEAGRFLYAMHPWTWRDNASALLSLTASQDYIALPAACASLLSIHLADPTSYYVVTMVSRDQFNQIKGRVSNPLYGWWVTMTQPTQTAATSLMPAQRLDIFPTPAANDSNYFRIVYAGRWVTLSDSTHVPNIPEDYESLLVALIRAFAKGYEEDDAGDVSARAQAVANGELARRLVAEDGQRNRIGAPLANGMLSERSYPHSSLYGTVTMPTL